MNHLKSASMVTETSSEMQTEEPKAHSYAEYCKTFKTSRRLQRLFSSKHNKKDFHAFDYEFCS